MLNLDNIDINQQFRSAEEAAEMIRRYIFQLYTEIDFRLEELDKKIKELQDEDS